MIDIHSHLVFNVDDGPNSLKDSLSMALTAEKRGFNIIVATPHYNQKSYSKKVLLKNFLKLAAGINECDIGILLGHEVLIDESSFEGSKSIRELTLNNTNYLLFELPFNLMPSCIENIMLDFHSNNIIPIIAHPERYRYFYNEIKNFICFIERGCLVQVDAGSIVGAYGRTIKKFAKQIIKLGLADFVASDAHSVEDYINFYPRSYELFVKWVGQKYADKLFYHNPGKVVRNYMLD